MGGGPTQITPPLISRTTGMPTMFVVAPILDDREKPLGLVGAGISLTYIQQIVQELKAGRTGYGFIIASDGKYIYHPNDAFIMQKKITEFGDPSVSALGKLMVSGGSGMDREIRSKIFDPFFTTKPVGEGTGLGLSVSYFIITETHKGTMDVVSEPGNGARFIIGIPLNVY